MEGIRKALKQHVEKLSKLKNRKEAKPGEASKSYLEEEFE